MNARNEITRLLEQNKDIVAANLNNLWRSWAEDMIKAGIDRSEVVESMLTVAMTQCVALAGTTKTAEYLEGCVAKMYLAADAGVEFPLKEEARH